MLDFEHLHHSCLVIGRYVDIKEDLFGAIEKRSGKMRGNPDVHIFHVETFGIDLARYVKRLQSQKAVSGKKFFVIAPLVFTREAQNALLKVFEEPTPDTHFFVVAENDTQILPTLQSRMQKISIARKKGKKKEISTINAGDFLQKKPHERIQSIQDLITKKDVENTLQFLDELENTIAASFSPHGNKVGEKEVESLEQTLSAIRLARANIQGGRGSIKMLLENIALVS